MDRYYTYRSQLENIIGYLFYRADLGADKIIEHNYLVVQIDGNFVSIDKHRDNKGCILIQYGKDLKSVALSLEGMPRKQ